MVEVNNIYKAVGD